MAKEWLGEGARPIVNDVGDHVFLSKDGLRKLRFDTQNLKGTDVPHAQLEVFRNGKWRDAISGYHHLNLRP